MKKVKSIFKKISNADPMIKQVIRNRKLGSVMIRKTNRKVSVNNKAACYRPPFSLPHVNRNQESGDTMTIRYYISITNLPQKTNI